MSIYRDPKAMAKTLRTELAARGIELGHSPCLEIVARQLGHADWNTVAARSTAPGALVVPKGWVVAGGDASDYQLGVDPARPGGVAIIRSLRNEGATGGFATLMQSVKAEAYRGQRWRLSAELRAEGAAGAVTMWMRCDDKARAQVAFDNMEQREGGVLSGTTDWQRREIVLDIPMTTQSLHYGFYLRGHGVGLARGFDLAPVGPEVAVTGNAGWLDGPMNLNFAG